VVLKIPEVEAVANRDKQNPDAEAHPEHTPGKAQFMITALHPCKQARDHARLILALRRRVPGVARRISLSAFTRSRSALIYPLSLFMLLSLSTRGYRQRQ
jgi:hypothetical protein